MDVAKSSHPGATNQGTGNGKGGKKEAYVTGKEKDGGNAARSQISRNAGGSGTQPTRQGEIRRNNAGVTARKKQPRTDKPRNRAEKQKRQYTFLNCRQSFSAPIGQTNHIKKNPERQQLPTEGDILE